MPIFTPERAKGYSGIVLQAIQAQLRIDSVRRDQDKLRTLQKEKGQQLLFSSMAKGGTEDQVQDITLIIKDVSNFIDHAGHLRDLVSVRHFGNFTQEAENAKFKLWQCCENSA